MEQSNSSGIHTNEDVENGKDLARQLADLAVKIIDEKRIPGYLAMIAVSSCIQSIMPYLIKDPKRGMQLFKEIIEVGIENFYQNIPD